MATAASLETTRLPRQIRERLARGAAILAESQTDGAAPPPIAAEAPQPGDSPNATPPGTPPAETPPTQLDANAAPRPELRPFHDPALATDPRAEDPTYWRQRLSVMQGKLHEERRAADSRESALRAQITGLEGQIRALKTAGTPAPVDVKAMFTPEQLEALGEDQAAAIATATIKVAQQQVDSTLAEQRAAAERQRTQETEQARARRQREFLDKLEEQVPDWQAIDQRVDWRKWLGEPDPITGQERQSALTAGIEAADVAGVTAIFRAFVKTLAPRPQPPATAPSDAGSNAAPPQSVVDRSLTPPTQAEIQDFYKRTSVNGGRGVSEAERVAFEKRLALL